MALSVLDIFTIGIGPSSTHTVAPMIAARRFAAALARHQSDPPTRVLVEFRGSLGAVGRRHGADKAVILGLMGFAPDAVDADDMSRVVERARIAGRIALMAGPSVKLDPASDLCFFENRGTSCGPASLRFTAFERSGRIVLERAYHVVGISEIVEDGADSSEPPAARPFPFQSANELLLSCKQQRSTIAELMWGNETAFRTRAETAIALFDVARTMNSAIDRGLRNRGDLPGKLHARREAPGLREGLEQQQGHVSSAEILWGDWVGAYAMAVAEENAAGQRVVAAPTNGSAGIVAALLRHFVEHSRSHRETDVADFLLTAGAIAMIFRTSGQPGRHGCQGEIGAAAAMGAGALVASLGGSPELALQAASMALEGCLGMPCRLSDGTIQRPCIQRNVSAAATAFSVARAVLRDRHYLSPMALDCAIKVMHAASESMQGELKRMDSRGLTVNVVEC